MSNLWIKGGVPREVNIDGFNFPPAADEPLSYSLSGRGGEVKLDGNGDPYQGSSPQIGGFELGYIIGDDDMVRIREIQSSGVKLSGYFTTAAGETFNFIGGIDGTDALTNEDGVVTIPFKGKVEPQ